MSVIKKKTWSEYFELIKSGKKNFELRLADFDIKEGDILVLEEYDPNTKEYTGRKLEKKVDKVFHFNLDSFGQKQQLEEKGFYMIQF